LGELLQKSSYPCNAVMSKYSMSMQRPRRSLLPVRLVNETRI